MQDLRSGLESQLGGDVASASTLLTQIADLNGKIAGAPKSDAGTADLLDRRDQAINTLSQYLDVQVSDQPDGSVTLLTASGATLVDHGAAASLAFDGRGSLSPEALYSADPAARGVGTVTATDAGRRQDRSRRHRRDPLRLDRRRVSRCATTPWSRRSASSTTSPPACRAP